MTVFLLIDDITAYLHLYRLRELVRMWLRVVLITFNFTLFFVRGTQFGVWPPQRPEPAIYHSSLVRKQAEE